MQGHLELEDIRKSYGSKEALKGVSLSVAKGEFFGFLGPNGAGKTTLMRILSGFIDADRGEMRVEGELLTGYAPKLRRSFGIVPQEIALYPTLSAWENCRVFGELYDIPSSLWKERAEKWLNGVGLWERKDDRVKDYSGGMKRRLNIAASLLHNPSILLCDEPTVGIDPQSRNAIFEFLEERNREGLTILYTTHYMEEAEKLCRRIAIIDEGLILREGSREDLLKEVEKGMRIVLKNSPDAGTKSKLEPFGDWIDRDTISELSVGGDVPLSTIFQVLENASISSADVDLRRAGLEELFLQLTGKTLRD